MTESQSPPPYPAEIFDVLESLLEEPTHVLDATAGEGALARALIARGRVARLDAVEPSPESIATARELPGGCHPDLHWIAGAVDTVPLNPPYSLITADSRLYQLPWEPTMARLAAVLGPHGVMAIVEQGNHRPPLALADELIARGLFRKSGEHRALPTPYDADDSQPIDVVATVVWGRPLTGD
ncbi:class I SAM-dependent methyltransferase [Actinospica sp. MGRD01-02]|uniref:Class I SAM-dependent methyltransferase n=1 Tax=Actinospica acidithermotolerans TaxID=2828514 RepID=A0A941EIN1_9ACTN|nr:class I SAM-dependent methyltransferase [Actinospica acidithermotolerans]MBR7831108.1 class I SAM-dependent methyltransferase [Actinospica acidithermotolerans]